MKVVKKGLEQKSKKIETSVALNPGPLPAYLQKSRYLFTNLFDGCEHFAFHVIGGVYFRSTFVV